ncbi:sphingosine-1-phosphate phosphatase 2-like, partial [Anneissia japonica]
MSSIGKYIHFLHSAEAVAEIQAYFGLEKIRTEDSARPHVSDHSGTDNGAIPASTKGNTYQRKHDEFEVSKCATPSHVAEETESNPLDSVIIKNKFWYYLFCFGAELGNKYFYLVFYPFFMWNFSPWLLRRAIYVWVVTMYIGQSAKELIKMPRPPCPPAIKMERRYEMEYGMPSTHAMVGLLMPFTLLLTSIGRFE